MRKLKWKERISQDLALVKKSLRSAKTVRGDRLLLVRRLKPGAAQEQSMKRWEPTWSHCSPPRITEKQQTCVTKPSWTSMLTTSIIRAGHLLDKDN